MRSTLSKIEMIDRAERLEVVLECFAIDHFTIESFRHKVSTSILFKQTRVGHPDAGGRCHQVVGKFNSAVALTSSKFLVLANSIELQQPMLKSGGGIELSTPHFVRFRIPGNDCLRSCAAGRSPNLYDVGESRLGFRGRQRRFPAQPAWPLPLALSSRRELNFPYVAPRAGRNSSAPMPLFPMYARRSSTVMELFSMPR